MFWLILLAIPHRRHRHRRRHGRFRHPMYWLTGLAFIEGALWIAALEIAGELLAAWWVLWWASRGLAAAGQAMWEATQPASAPGPDWRGAVDGARPPWPKRQAVSRLAATARYPRDCRAGYCSPDAQAAYWPANAPHPATAARRDQATHSSGADRPDRGSPCDRRSRNASRHARKSPAA